MRVAVHGSCRVHDPFETLADAGQAMRVLGYYVAVSHTLGEIEQAFGYFRGEGRIPEPLLKFVFSDPAQIPSPEPRDRRILDGVDAVVVEVSELRQVRFRDTFFQINVFMNNFVSRFGAILLPWYRAFSTGRPISEAMVEEALSGLEQNGVAEDRLALFGAVMRETQLESVTLDSAIASIKAMTDGSPAHWLFVSHFVVPGLGGNLMADRARLRDVLQEATAQCRVGFFDPSTLVARHSREVALANNGADIYHYDPKFQSAIAHEALKIFGSAQTPGSPLGARDEPQARLVEVQPVAAALNEELVALHHGRLKKGNIEKAGLYQHYAGLLREGRLVGKRDIEIADLVANYLPPFDHYHVLRAGLGEIAFLLAPFVSKVSAFDPFPTRFGAIVAGRDHLSRSRFALGEKFQTANELVPGPASTEGAFAVATQLAYTCSQKEEDDLLGRLENYAGLLFDPGNLIRSRPDIADRERLLERFRQAGFTSIKDYPYLNLVYCAKPRGRATPAT